MINYFVAKPNGDIVCTGQCPKEQLSIQAFGKNVAIEGTCDLITDKYDHKKKKIVKQTKRKRNKNQMESIRHERNMRLTISSHDLAELMLPDSFPNMTAEQKQTRIDAMIAYRVKLRDITDQDPENIEWPELP